MSYPAYDSYKDSGVEWLGDVPSGWDVKRLKYLCTVNDETLPENTDPEMLVNYVDISSVNLIDGITNIEPLEFEKSPSRARRIVKDGDTIVSTVRTYLKAIAQIIDPVENLIVSTGFCVVRPHKNVDHAYLGYSLQSEGFVGEVVSKSVGVSYPAINPDGIISIESALPSIPEQKAIAVFLDERTLAVDALIAKKEKLLELLAEKRTALITQAVTKGLDPTAPMKPSGIDWLGDVPKVWEAIKLRFLCKINTGSRDTENRISGAKYPFFVRSQTIERIDTFALDCEAVLTAGDGVGVGKVFHYYDGKFDFHQRVYAFTDFHKIQGKFFFQFFSQFFGLQMNIYSAKSTVDSVRRPFLQELIMCVPPEDEQTRIVEFLEHEIVKFDKMEKAVQDAIFKLKEYRTAIITNAVTGKIKVI